MMPLNFVPDYRFILVETIRFPQKPNGNMLAGPGWRRHFTLVRRSLLT